MKVNRQFENCPEDALIENRVELKRILGKSNKVIGVFSGPQHWNKCIEENGINYYLVGSLIENLNKNGIPDGAYMTVSINEKGIEALENHLSIDKKINREEFENYINKRMYQLKNIENETFVIGIHLEGSFLSPHKAGIQDNTNFLTPSIKNFKELTGDFENIIKIVTIAPEEDVDLIDYLNEKNIIPQAGHTIGAALKNTKGVTHIFNAMNPIHHRNPSIALEALVRDDIYCEVIGDLIHLSKNILTLILKSKPKKRIMLVSDSLPLSNYDNDIIFCNKKIDKFAKDEKGTLAGSNKTLDEICHNLIKNNIMTQDEIELFAFKNQIDYLDIKAREIDILNK